MTRFLDGLFHAAGVLSAILLAAIAVLTFVQIVGRAMGYLVSTGVEFAGFCMAASIFLALAWTLRSGGHIRVELFVRRLPPAARRAAEVWALGTGALAVGLLAWSSASMTWDSWRFGDVSVGMVPVPLWIPQAAMALGVALLEVALIEQIVLVARGREPTYRPFEEAEGQAADAQTRGG